MLTEKGMALDLGFIAKGYIADRIKEYLSGEGVKSAIISLGGNILAIGERPDGSPFHVGIQKPFADTGTAHFFPRQDSFKNHLRRQAKLFRRQLADDFQGAFFALAVDAASRTFPVKNTAKL